jgi:hypothetical protein
MVDFYKLLFNFFFARDADMPSKKKSVSGNNGEKLRAAAIAAVLAHMRSQKGAAAWISGKAAPSSGRDNWKMAGRRERLGI